MTRSQTAAIILAAGPSSRMGQPKQMLDIHGETLLTRTVREVTESGIKYIVVVLGANEEAHRKVLKDSSVEIVFNPGWKLGMGSSIKTGLKRLLTHHNDVNSAVILVCDQPMLRSDVVSNLIGKYQQTRKPIIASEYSGVPGVPVLFAKSYFKKLEALPDDAGAKKLILQNPSDVALVPFPGGEVDLDTWEDYETFLRGGNRES